jgi:hypothetical protein
MGYIYLFNVKKFRSNSYGCELWKNKYKVKLKKKEYVDLAYKKKEM